MGLVALQHVGSSWTRARTCVPCIGRRILNHCATREAPSYALISIIPFFYNNRILVGYITAQNKSTFLSLPCSQALWWDKVIANKIWEVCALKRKESVLPLTFSFISLSEIFLSFVIAHTMGGLDLICIWLDEGLLPNLMNENMCDSWGQICVFYSTSVQYKLWKQQNYPSYFWKSNEDILILKSTHLCKTYSSGNYIHLLQYSLSFKRMFYQRMRSIYRLLCLS